MKTRKGIAAVLAGVMALAALPFSALSAGAESAYAPGDVDMDGYITAHDAAVVSRALYVDETALNDEQKQLADVNGDGVVDQTDADWIYEHSEYKLGAVNQKEYMSSTTLFYQMYYIARKGAGYHDALLTDGSIPESSAEENEVYHDNCITQVCYNLLDNAIKFSAEGSTMGLSITAKGGKAHVAVRNHGDTIPPDELAMIFDRFHKSDKSRSVDREGVGLGLYIVKTILNNHKENISVTSQDGVTEFVFTLTLA